MIRIGLIGAGPNGADHARYYNQSSRSELVAIADPDRERAQALATELGTQAVADYHEFLDHVDAVVISSPNFLHREHAVACAEAGKHIYCEKPMGISLDEAEQIAQAVQKAGVKSVVGFATRFTPPFQTMEQVLKQEKLGQIISVCSRRLVYSDPAHMAGWRRDHNLSGGLLLEINIHELDWMLSVGGLVESVYARAWAANPVSPRSNDHLWITLNFKSGAVGSHEGSWVSSVPNFYRSVEGTKGGLNTDEWGSQVYLAQPGENRETLSLGDGFDLRGHFLDCIEKNVAPVADTNWGLHVMAVTEAIFESIASKAVAHVKL